VPSSRDAQRYDSSNIGWLDDAWSMRPEMVVCHCMSKAAVLWQLPVLGHQSFLGRGGVHMQQWQQSFILPPWILPPCMQYTACMYSTPHLHERLLYQSLNADSTTQPPARLPACAAGSPDRYMRHRHIWNDHVADHSKWVVIAQHPFSNMNAEPIEHTTHTTGRCCRNVHMCCSWC
jgi:hypothetical protein